MRWLGLTAVTLLAACGAPEVQSQRLKDGSWTFQCELAMEECVRRVQDKCPHQRYRILEGTSETRLRDAPPFERAYHTSRLHLVCNDDGADILLSVDSSKQATKPVAATTGRLCSTGQTRECVGPAACKGGQACLADGTGYGPCDCGPAPSAAAAAPTESHVEVVTSPAAAPASPTPASSPSPVPSPTPAAPSR